jgi:hypothetical protein
MKTFFVAFATSTLISLYVGTSVREDITVTRESVLAAMILSIGVGGLAMCIELIVLFIRDVGQWIWQWMSRRMFHRYHQPIDGV